MISARRFLVVAIGFALTVATAAQRSAPNEPRLQHRPDIPAVNGLVTAGHPLAAAAGVRVLMQGGNAFDASVATLAVLNVVRPQMSGAAGNGFFTIYDAASAGIHSLNATGAAPLGFDPAQVEASDLSRGIKAGVVPGLFGGWVALLDRFGTMTLAELLQPAIDYAENGHSIEPSVAQTIERQRESLAEFPSSARVFLPGGSLPRPGQTLWMKDLARTFRKLVAAEKRALKRGQSRSEALQAAFDRFYKGDIAQEMARFYEENGGFFRLADFANYKPLWREPIHISYHGYDVYTSPTTSRGGLEVLMQLKLVEGFDLPSMAAGSPGVLHLTIEAIKLAKSEIYEHVADPKFYRMPLPEMLSDRYAKTRRREIQKGKAMNYPGPVIKRTGPIHAARDPNGQAWDEGSVAGSTTSFSIIDRDGNVVAATPTHGSLFGTGVVVGSTGLTFNNGTRIGSTSPYPDDVNYVRAGQIPILNNSPVVVMKDGEFVLALGTPGGETIGQTQFQVLINILDFGMPIQKAIEAPRLALVADPNFYKEGSAITVRLEARFSETTLDALKSWGHIVQSSGGYSLGSIQGIWRDTATGNLFGGADSRRAAYAIGF